MARSTGLLRAFWIALVLALATIAHIYSFRLSLPRRFPRDVIPHVAPGLVAIVLGAWLGVRVARIAGRKPRHVALVIASLVIFASGVGLGTVHQDGSGTVDITSPPLELAFGLAHFVGMIVLLVGAFRTLRKDYLDA